MVCADSTLKQETRRKAGSSFGKAVGALGLDRSTTTRHSERKQTTGEQQERAGLGDGDWRTRNCGESPNGEVKGRQEKVKGARRRPGELSGRTGGGAKYEGEKAVAKLIAAEQEGELSGRADYGYIGDRTSRIQSIKHVEKETFTSVKVEMDNPQHRNVRWWRCLASKVEVDD